MIAPAGGVATSAGMAGPLPSEYARWLASAFRTYCGSQFTAKDFKQLVRDFELEHIRIRTYHPELNGKVQRFHRSTRDGLGEQELKKLGQAREIIDHWVSYYNTKRLHASLDYLPPAEYWEGDPEARKKERREKLERGRKRRELINRARQEKAA